MGIGKSNALWGLRGLGLVHSFNRCSELTASGCTLHITVLYKPDYPVKKDREYFPLSSR